MDHFAPLPAAERAIVFREAAARLRVGSATIIEKDFWVCWTLQKIFSNAALPGPLFKGGTSLSNDLRDDAGSLARIEQVRQMLDVPDDPAEMRTEFYGNGFYAAESCTLAFPWVFTINNKARYGNQEGPFELQLAVTRDLRNWPRPFRVPCAPRGEPGDWECGIQQTASRAIRVGDEIWLYYCGANYRHGAPVLYREHDPERKRRYTKVGPSACVFILIRLSCTRSHFGGLNQQQHFHSRQRLSLLCFLLTQDSPRRF